MSSPEFRRSLILSMGSVLNIFCMKCHLAPVSSCIEPISWKMAKNLEIFQHKIWQKLTFFNTSLEFLASYLQFGMCSAEKKQSLKLGKSNLPFSVVSNLSSILLVFWSLKYDYSHKWAIFAYTKPNWPKKDENMYKNYRKYKKNGFGIELESRIFESLFQRRMLKAP